MPLKLIDPRRGKTPYYYVRGAYLRTRVDRSTGSGEKPVATKILLRWKTEIERGEYLDPRAPAPEPVEPEVIPTFATAAIAYMKAGGEATYLDPILVAIGRTPLRDINQILLDTTARQLYPQAPSPTLNRNFYTPVSAVLKRAGIETPIKRPKGWRGKKSTSWLDPHQAFTLFGCADALDAEFGTFLRFLLATGMRLSEALSVTLGQVDLDRQFLYLPETKNTEPRAVYLPRALVKTLKNQPPRPSRPRAVIGHRLPNGAGGKSQEDAGVPFLKRVGTRRLFRFHAGGRLRDLLATAMHNAGLTFPRRQCGFHIFCHTYGSWMHRYGSLDTFGLTRTGRWADPRSADRYKHTEVSSESRRAEMFPAERRKANR